MNKKNNEKINKYIFYSIKMKTIQLEEQAISKFYNRMQEGQK